MSTVMRLAPAHAAAPVAADGLSQVRSLVEVPAAFPEPQVD
jgi:hypothetical protein